MLFLNYEKKIPISVITVFLIHPFFEYVALNWDLIKTLSNPFSNYKYNMRFDNHLGLMHVDIDALKFRMYHTVAWGSGLTTAMVLRAAPSATGLFLDVDDHGFCWIAERSQILIAMFYIPVAIFIGRLCPFILCSLTLTPT